MESIFLVIGSLFERIMRLLIIEQGVREETLLHFVTINKTDGSRWLYDYSSSDERFIGKPWELSEVTGKEYKTPLDYVYNKYGEEKILVEYVELSYIENNEIEVWCVCTSPCIERNQGRLLLGRVFTKFVDYISLWCKRVEVGDSDLEIRNKDEWTKNILQSAASDACEEIECLYRPLKLSNIISLSGEYYERTECEANLVFLPWIEGRKIQSKNLIYDFRKRKNDTEIRFLPENIRLIRKFLQMTPSKDGLFLVLQKMQSELIYEVIGICKNDQISKLLKEKDGPWCIVKMKKHMHWELYLGDTYVFSYRNGNYKIATRLNQQELEKRCESIFGIGRSYKEVVKAIEKCREQAHGTILIVLESEYAKKEVSRLSKLEYGLKNAKPKECYAQLNDLNAIDGAMFIDIDGKVHGIGMILDGNTAIKGNIGRGARFNSSQKYIARMRSRNISVLLLIVSEDGTVEIMDSA